MKISILLIISLFLFSQSGQAQDDSSNSSQSRVNCETHTVTNETTKTSSTITRCLNEGVVDLQDKKPKPKESGAKGDENLQHHGDPFNTFSDLNAQISMAESTDAIRIYTFIGVFIGLIGSFLVGLTLLYTKGAMEATKETLRQTIETTRQAELATKIATEQLTQSRDSQKAYLMFEAHSQNEVNSGFLVISAVFKNYGQTPALDVRSHHTWIAINEGEEDKVVPMNLDYEVSQDCHVGPGGSFNVRIPVHHSNLPNIADDILSGRKHALIAIRLVYNDIYGTQNDIQVFGFLYHYSEGRTVGQQRMVAMSMTPRKLNIEFNNDGAPKHSWTNASTRGKGKDPD